MINVSRNYRLCCSGLCHTNKPQFMKENGKSINVFGSMFPELEIWIFSHLFPCMRPKPFSHENGTLHVECLNYNLRKSSCVKYVRNWRKGWKIFRNKTAPNMFHFRLICTLKYNYSLHSVNSKTPLSQSKQNIQYALQRSLHPPRTLKSKICVVNRQFLHFPWHKQEYLYVSVKWTCHKSMDNAGRRNIYPLNSTLLLLSSDNESEEVANKSMLCGMMHWRCAYIYCTSSHLVSFDSEHLLLRIRFV